MRRGGVMDILWRPEGGTCSWCGEEREGSRGHSDGTAYWTCCFPCWDAQQDGCIIGEEEWAEDTAYVFHSDDRSRPDGTAQGAFPN